MVRSYKDKELLDKVKSLSSFSSIPSSRWILGVRSKEDESNVFDDKFYIFEGEKFIDVITGTTHPGATILKNYHKYNSKGAAVVESDKWYYDLWVFGMHKGKIPALLQLGNKISVYRDGDKDGKSEEIGEKQIGFFGINWHLNSYNLTSKLTKTQINDWSAGCQVPNDTTKYMKQMEYFKTCKHKITYCLINEF
jgi:hypothetical protein